MEEAGAEFGFLPVAAPASAFAMSPNDYYKTDEEYMMAGAEALREEYKTIIEAGLFVQIDDAHLPLMFDSMVPPSTAKLQSLAEGARLVTDLLWKKQYRG